MKLIRPPKSQAPSEWALKNRRLPDDAAIPGPFDASRTPWAAEIEDAFHNPKYRRVIEVCGSQMSKTESCLNIIGERMDNNPGPGIYVGPSKSFVTGQMEPRLMTMIDQAETLSEKIARGKKSNQTRKKISGVDLRLAWAGSATELASFPASFAIIDERDRMDGNVKGEGDPVELVETRGDTYYDFTLAVFSTPLIGNVETVHCKTTNLTRWDEAEPEQVHSPTWKLWQEGTRHEFAWPCPVCDEYFIARFDLLKWPKGLSPAEAAKQAYIECPHCGGVIEDHHKADMNQRGRAVAPGQSITPAGEIIGDPPETDTYSLWISGLCSPWRTFGQRASRFLRAVRSGDSDRIQTAINTGFGELFKIAGADAVQWAEIASKREDYSYGEIPELVQKITCAVDVQKDRLIYVIRGWGPKWESWLLDAGDLWGDTRLDDVWNQLQALLADGVNGRNIDLTLVDSGFRPGKPIVFPLNMVYEFCRRNKGRVRATKGRSSLDKPYKMSRIDLNTRGRVLKNGLELWHLDTDWCKSWVQARLDLDEEQVGRFHFGRDVTDDYCRALVSEVRVVKPSGAVSWVRLHKENHYLDCEAMSAAAAHMIGVHRLVPSNDDAQEKQSLGSRMAQNNR